MALAGDNLRRLKPAMMSPPSRIIGVGERTWSARVGEGFSYSAWRDALSLGSAWHCVLARSCWPSYRLPTASCWSARGVSIITRMHLSERKKAWSLTLSISDSELDPHVFSQLHALPPWVSRSLSVAVSRC